MDFEFVISQYADGSLPEPERGAVEARLASDASARALLAEYRQLDALLDHHAPAVPELNWELVSETICAAVAEAEEPVQSYRLFSWTRAIPVAAAAMVLLAVGIGVRVYMAAHLSIPENPVARGGPQRVSVQVAEVTGPKAEFSTDGTSEVSIGPAKSATDEPMVVNYADDVITRPARVVIASAYNSEQDTPGLPY